MRSPVRPASRGARPCASRPSSRGAGPAGSSRCSRPSWWRSRRRVRTAPLADRGNRPDSGNRACGPDRPTPGKGNESGRPAASPDRPAPRPRPGAPTRLRGAERTGISREVAGDRAGAPLRWRRDMGSHGPTAGLWRAVPAAADSRSGAGRVARARAGPKTTMPRPSRARAGVPASSRPTSRSERRATGFTTRSGAHRASTGEVEDADACAAPPGEARAGIGSLCRHRTRASAAARSRRSARCDDAEGAKYVKPLIKPGTRRSPPIR